MTKLTPNEQEKRDHTLKGIGIFLSSLALALAFALALALDVLALALALDVLALALAIVLALAVDNDNQFAFHEPIGFITGLIIGIIIFAVFFAAHQLPQPTTYTQAITITGATYQINVTYNLTNHCIAVNSATYFTANAAGVSSTKLNSTALASLSKYLNCTK